MTSRHVPGRRTSRARTARPRLRPYERLYLNLSRAIILVCIVLALAPAYWVVTAYFQAGSAFFSSTLLPEHLTLENYQALFSQSDFRLWVRNSLILCLSVSTLSTIAAALAGYAFSRLRFWGRRYGLMSWLVAGMFPTMVALPAYYTLLLKLGLLNTFFGLMLILVGGSIPFYTWLLKGYLDQLPRELDESATVDGATTFQALWFIVLPLATPMLVVIFLFAFISVYSEYIISSLVLSSPDLYTLPLGLRGFVYNQFSTHWTQFSAAAVLGSIPLMILFLLTQRYLVAGLTRGAVKG
jgi:arabinogalactan oligomer/maltooligosaccharide transport system permease protein